MTVMHYDGLFLMCKNAWEFAHFKQCTNWTGYETRCKVYICCKEVNDTTLLTCQHEQAINKVEACSWVLISFMFRPTHALLHAKLHHNDWFCTGWRWKSLGQGNTLNFGCWVQKINTGTYTTQLYCIVHLFTVASSPGYEWQWNWERCIKLPVMEWWRKPVMQ